MTTTSATRTTRRPALSGRRRVGLGIAALLALMDILPLAWLPIDVPTEFLPGTTFLIMLTGFGLLTLAAVGAYLGTRRRAWLRVAAAVRTVSALTAVPAFFVDGVPPVLVTIAAVCVGLTILAVVLLLSPDPADD